MHSRSNKHCSVTTTIEPQARFASSKPDMHLLTGTTRERRDHKESAPACKHEHIENVTEQKTNNTDTIQERVYSSLIACEHKSLHILTKNYKTLWKVTEHYCKFHYRKLRKDTKSFWKLQTLTKKIRKVIITDCYEKLSVHLTKKYVCILQNFWKFRDTSDQSLRNYCVFLKVWKSLIESYKLHICFTRIQKNISRAQCLQIQGRGQWKHTLGTRALVISCQTKQDRRLERHFFNRSVRKSDLKRISSLIICH